jgi:hypothetical protein
MIIQLKEITDSSWLVITEKEQEKIGLLSGKMDGSYTLLSKGGKVGFTDQDEVVEFFAEPVFENVIVTTLTTDTVHTVKGFPVDFANPFEADSEDEISDLPLYTKTKTSTVYHCAGYYCIRFPKGWQDAYSPKLSTLQKYEYVGPFKNDLECKSHLTICKNKEKR